MLNCLGKKMSPRKVTKKTMTRMVKTTMISMAASLLTVSVEVTMILMMIMEVVRLIETFLI